MLKLKLGLRLGAAADTVQYLGTLHGPSMKRKLTGTWGEPGSSTLNGDPKRGEGSGPRPVTTMSLAGPETGRRGCNVLTVRRGCVPRSRGGSRQAAYIKGRPGLSCSLCLGNTAQPAETGVK